MGAVSVSRVRVAIESTARVGCAVATSLVREIERLDPMIVRERLDAWKLSPDVNPKHVPGLGTVRSVLVHIAWKHHTHKVGERGVGYYDETNDQACGKLWIDESTYKACLRFLEWTGALQTLAPAAKHRGAKRRLYPEYLDPQRTPTRVGGGHRGGTSPSTQAPQRSKGGASHPSKSVSNTPRTQDVAAHGATSLRFHDPAVTDLYGLNLPQQETDKQ